MSVTYPEDHIDPISEETFVPVYARGRSARKQGGFKTWMILAPIGAIAVIGGGALMFMGGSNEANEAALVEPAATAPVLPLTPAPAEAAAAPLTSAAAPAAVEAAPQPAPAPVVREAAPARRAAPAPAARRAAPAPAPRVEAPVEQTGPRSYTPTPAAASPTASLNTTPATPAPAPRAPVISTQPLN